MSEHSNIWQPVAESLGVWQYDDNLDIDLGRIPQAVILEAARRGFTHVLNNEAMSKAGTVVDKAIAAGEVDADEREAKRQELIDEYRKAYVATFYDGTWGTGRRAASGPRVDALETEFNRLVAKEVREVLTKDKRYNWDKVAKNWFIVVAGQPNRVVTLEGAVEAYLGRMTDAKREALTDAAREIVEAKKRQAAATKAATAQQPTSTEDLPF
jgi:hypothetical protein